MREPHLSGTRAGAHAVLRTGLIAGLVSGAAALVLSRLQSGRAAPAMNAVSHIADGGPPPAASGSGGRNLLLGSGLHMVAAVLWAACFEPLFGRAARRRRSAACLGAAATATAAYLADYHVVPRRLRPGMEAFLDPPAVAAVYAPLALGFAVAARSQPAAAHAASVHGAAQTVGEQPGIPAGPASPVGPSRLRPS